MENIELIKRLREETGCGVIEAKKALEESPSFEAAKAVLRERGLERAAKKEGRETAQGLVGTYHHSNGRVGSLVTLTCETDFVARTEDFKKLLAELTLQVAAMNPASVTELLDQEYIRDSRLKVRDLLVELSAKVGENIVIRDIKRLAI